MVPNDLDACDRVEFTDGTVVELIDFDITGRAKSEEALCELAGQRVNAPRRTPR